MHNQPREPQSYEDCQAKSIQEFGWTSQGMDWGWGQASRAPHTDVSRNLDTVVVRGVLPGLREEELDCCPVVQSPLSDESKFCISFGNQGPRVWRKDGEAHSISYLKSSVKFHSLWWFGVQCHLLVLVHRVFFENQRHCTRLPRNVGALHASFSWTAF